MYNRSILTLSSSTQLQLLLLLFVYWHILFHFLINSLKFHFTFRNPTPEESPLLQNIKWPAVDPQDPGNIKYLNINETLEVRNNPRYYQEVKSTFESYVYPYYMQMFSKH